MFQHIDDRVGRSISDPATMLEDIQKFRVQIAEKILKGIVPVNNGAIAARLLPWGPRLLPANAKLANPPRTRYNTT